MKTRFTEIDYALPQERIAFAPSAKRGEDKLLAYDTKTNTVRYDTFSNIYQYIPKNTLCVLNKSSVIPSRIRLKKNVGGEVVILFLLNEKIVSNTVRIMVDRKVQLGTVLTTEKNLIIGTIKNHSEKSIFILELAITRAKLMHFLLLYGSAPLPQYIKKTPLSATEQKKRYQTIYAQQSALIGSIAAPTAGMHFTKEILSTLKKQGTHIHYVTLHVGLGTFAPLTAEHIQTKKLHEELYSVSNTTYKTLEQAHKNSDPILAVGTTTIRTLESLAKTHILSGSTDIFLYPPHTFHYPTMLLTNFHLPKTSLMLLVQAFLQYKKSKKNLVELYTLAIQKQYAFYSFGDSMLIL